MVTRRRTTANATASITTTASLLLIAVLGIATIAEGAFHEGITGSSLRFETRWNRNEQTTKRKQQQLQHQHQQQQQQNKSSRNLQSFTGSKSAKESCEAAKAKEEGDFAPGGGTSQCSCEQSVMDERYADFSDPDDQPIVWELTCVDQRCSYCSADGTTCDRFSYGALFEQVTVREGLEIKDAVAQVGYFETNQYIVGRPEAVVYTEYNDPAAPGSHACSMEIDGLLCAVCEYTNCVGEREGEQSRSNDGLDIYYGLNIVCSNILIGDGAGGYIPASDFATCEKEQLDAIGNSQGVFQMYDPDYGQCFTSVEGCDRDKIEMEQNGYYDCECITKEDIPTTGVSPFLENAMLRCNVKGDATTKPCDTLEMDTIERTYSSYVKETNTRTIRLESSSTLVIEEFDCLLTRGFSDGCSQCKASIDGVECSSCEMTECGTGTEEEGSLAPTISCGNASDELLDNDSKPIDLCRPETSVNTPFEAFSVCGFGESSMVPVVLTIEPPVLSMMACNEQKNEFLQRTDNFIDSKVLKCECYLINDENSSVDAGTLFECTSNGGTCGTTNGGSVCNGNYSGEDDENGLCFREELVEGFLPNGSRTPLTRTTTYTHGKAQGNSMVGRTLVLTEYGKGSNGCQLLVDGEACASCQLENCGGDIGMRPLVDCSNIIDDDSFELKTCEAFSSYEEKGFLSRLTSGANGDFGTCREESEKNTSNNKVDTSLPMVCEKAQPIVLPTQRDDLVGINKDADLTNPNSIFAFVSFVSSTDGLELTKNELASVVTTCGKEVDENDELLFQKSPGLWYSLEGTGTGIHASVCRKATNFDARISIYEGSCDSMDCIASTPMDASALDTSCDVHWVAEEGTTYYLRVHGTDASQTGTFNLFLETLDSDATSTCYSDETEQFDEACLSCAKARESRVLQFPNDPAELDCQCLENAGTGGYHLTCVDLSCLKCNPRQDVCGFGTYEQEIKRTGDSPTGGYESFYFMNKAEGAQADEIVSLQNTGCLEIQDPYQQCMVAKEGLMAKKAEDIIDIAALDADSAGSPVFCECRQTSPEGDQMLICSLYNSYEYCSTGAGIEQQQDDGAVCADTLLFGQSISQYGSVTSEFRSYVLGDEEGKEERSIIVERSSDMCFVTINNEACSSCEILQSCVNNKDEDVLSIAASSGMGIFTDLSIDCSNLVTDDEEGISATFECGSAGIGGDKNLLSILVGTVSATNKETDQNQTIPPNAFPPKLPPIKQPTPVSFNDEDKNVTTTPTASEEDTKELPLNTTASNDTTTDGDAKESSTATSLVSSSVMVCATASAMTLASLLLWL